MSSLYAHSLGELAILRAVIASILGLFLIVPNFYLQTKLSPQFQICISNSPLDILLGCLIGISIYMAQTKFLIALYLPFPFTCIQHLSVLSW